MQISSMSPYSQSSAVYNQTRMGKPPEGSPGEEAGESASERAAEQQRKAMSQSKGIGKNVNILA